MAKLSALTSLKESDLQIPDGPITGTILREAFQRLFLQLNPYFDGINRLAAGGITFTDNIYCDLIVGKFSHAVAQQVALKNLKRAGSAHVLSADGKTPYGAPSVQMVQLPPASKSGPLANVAVYFRDTASLNVTCTLLLLPEGGQTTSFPAP
jgi:hypothetical protein